jgi:hypothetical protein
VSNFSTRPFFFSPANSQKAETHCQRSKERQNREDYILLRGKPIPKVCKRIEHKENKEGDLTGLEFLGKIASLLEELVVMRFAI